MSDTLPVGLPASVVQASRGRDLHGLAWDPGFLDEVDLRDRALAAVGEGITISDMTLPDNPIVYANRAFEDLTGYSPEEVIGRNCRFLQGPGTDPKAVDRLRRAIAEGAECRVELLNYRKDGTPFWNRLSITPIRDEVGNVTNYIGVQSDVTARRRAEEKLKRAQKELESAYRRVSRSLEAAARVQRAMLPTETPEVPGLEIAWTFEPCYELAGDALGVVPLDEGRFGIYLLDVSGHGVPAALLAVSLGRVLSAVRGQSVLFADGRRPDETARVASPPEVADALNRRFPMSLDTRQYFTLFYGIWEVDSRRLRYVSTGHPPPIHLPAAGEPRLLPADGLPIGLVEGAEHEEREVTLSPGDRLFLYTDGLTEATAVDGREYGAERLTAEVESRRGEPLAGLVEALPAAVEAWAGGRRIADDVSVLALEALR